MLIVMLVCGFLSGVLNRHLDSAGTFMQVIGGAYMVWLAWNLWQSRGVHNENIQGGGKLLLTGCVLQLVNPKLIAYGITAFSVFILPNFYDVTSILWFAGLLAAVGFAGTITWAFGGVALQKIFQQHPVLINRVLAFLVLGCAVSMFFET